jgi:hypothetical protein
MIPLIRAKGKPLDIGAFEVQRTSAVLAHSPPIATAVLADTFYS